jgi:FemAB-related protein (PEP-CTERM system-associated)
MRLTNPIVVVDAEEAEWQKFVLRRADASGYHDWAWRRVFEKSFGHETTYLAAKRDGDVVGVLPLVLFRTGIFGRFVSSLPFVNYGGVVTSDDAAAEALLERATEIARSGRMAYLELRHCASQFPALPSRSHKVAMVLELPVDAETMWTRLDKKARNQARRAEKSDLTYARGAADLLPEFYDVFARNMRDLGTPVYSRRFFETVFAELPDEMSIHVVRHGNRAVAAGIAYAHGHAYEMPWASSLRTERARCPNHILYWEAIKHAIDLRCMAFDFGRSTPGEGTFHFKQQWGAEPHPLYWEYRLLTRAAVPNQSPSNPRYRAAIALWKRLPVGLTRVIGPSIVKRIA